MVSRRMAIHSSNSSYITGNRNGTNITVLPVQDFLLPSPAQQQKGQQAHPHHQFNPFDTPSTSSSPPKPTHSMTSLQSYITWTKPALRSVPASVTLPLLPLTSPPQLPPHSSTAAAAAATPTPSAPVHQQARFHARQQFVQQRRQPLGYPHHQPQGE
jgi:hypothetical protein